MYKMSKTNISKKGKYLIFVSLVVVVVLIISIDPFAIIISDGGGDGELYSPSSELDDIGEPALNTITKDFSFQYTLTWEFTSPYPVEQYVILERIDSGNWFYYDTTIFKQFQLYCFTSGIYEFKIVALVLHDGKTYNSQHSNIRSFEILSTDVTPILQPIIPNPNTDGKIDLHWNQILSIDGYRVYKLISGSWTLIAEVSSSTTSYTDIVDEDGTYKYYVASYKTKFLKTEENPSVIQSVVVEIYVEPEPEPEPPEPVLPSNPLIIINGGAEITHSFTITLTLYCNFADEMQFEIANGVFTTWVSYSTSYTIKLSENDLQYPNYRIGVTFRNEDGSSDVVYDTITYEPPVVPLPEPEPEVNGKATDYTLIYILVGILGGIVGIGIFLRYRTKKITSKNN